jgi:hypothetical protein
LSHRRHNKIKDATNATEDGCQDSEESKTADSDKDADYDVEDDIDTIYDSNGDGAGFGDGINGFQNDGPTVVYVNDCHVYHFFALPKSAAKRMTT